MGSAKNIATRFLNRNNTRTTKHNNEQLTAMDCLADVSTVSSAS
jgi:hypothetical protein